MDRRDFVKGSTAAGAVLATGLVGISGQALAATGPASTFPPPPLSPLFGNFTNFYQRCHADNGKVAITILKARPEDIVRVASIEEAEDDLLGTAILGFSMQRGFFNDEDGVFDIDSAVWLSGAGSMVMFHPRGGRDQGRVFAHPDLLASKGTAGEEIGSWSRHFPSTAPELSFWSNPRLPKDRFYITRHNSNLDCPGGLAYDESGTLTYLKPASVFINTPHFDDHYIAQVELI